MRRYFTLRATIPWGDVEHHVYVEDLAAAESAALEWGAMVGAVAVRILADDCKMSQVYIPAASRRIEWTGTTPARRAPTVDRLAALHERIEATNALFANR